MEISKTEFLDISIIYYDHISCVKHVLDPLYVFYTMHQSLLPKNNDAQNTTKCGFLLRLDAQIVALCMHCP